MKDLRTIVWAGDNTLEGLAPEMLIVDSSPDGIVAAPSGSIAVNPTTGAMYAKTETNATSWATIGGTPPITGAHSVEIHANASANLTVAGAIFPADHADLGNNARTRRRVDTTGYTQIRITCAITTLSASVNGARLHTQVADAYLPTTWTTLGDGLVASGDAIDLSAATGVTGVELATNWIDLGAHAGDLVYRVCQDGGDGASGYALAHCGIEFR